MPLNKNEDSMQNHRIAIEHVEKELEMTPEERIRKIIMAVEQIDKAILEGRQEMVA